MHEQKVVIMRFKYLTDPFLGKVEKRKFLTTSWILKRKKGT